MASQSAPQPIPASRQLIASPLNTLIVVAVVALNAYRGVLNAARFHAGLGTTRTHMYLRTIVAELVVLGIVVTGVRLRGASLQTVFGHRWHSAGQVVRDLGLGVILLITSTGVVSILSGLRDGGHDNQSISYLLPQTSTELLLWLTLSLTAGICEEAIFRGYLQVQFTAMTRSAAAGILISAGAFGAAHAYQGWGRALVIIPMGVIFGIVAHWRGTVRPGMFAHTLQDAIAPFLLKLVDH